MSARQAMRSIQTDRYVRPFLVVLLLMLVVCAPGPGDTAFADSADLKDFVIGYVGWNDDPRYVPSRMEQHFQGDPWGRPIAGARVAVEESKFLGMGAGVSFSLEKDLDENTQAVFKSISDMLAHGTRFILLDLPGGTISRVAAKFADRRVTFFNISSRDDRLRNAHCQADLLHTIASDAQRNDALAQYLVSRQWAKVLLLVGPRTSDKILAKSFKRSARRFGLDIVDTRNFVLGNNPRNRDKNNVKLLTSGVDYDVVYIADTQGEFSRAANYAVQHPRPVIGSAGLVPQVWHWSWRTYGARQLQHRLDGQANRAMTAYDWAAWIAVKAIASSVQRVGGADYKKVSAYLRSDKLKLDSVKGYRVDFRDWDRQLRQPILLASGNWVIARAPLKGFEHPTNYLDTLGFDPRESTCKLTSGRQERD